MEHNRFISRYWLTLAIAVVFAAAIFLTVPTAAKAGVVWDIPLPGDTIPPDDDPPVEEPTGSGSDDTITVEEFLGHDSNKGHGNDLDGIDEDNPGNSWDDYDVESSDVDDDDGNNGHGNSGGHDDSNPGNGHGNSGNGHGHDD